MPFIPFAATIGSALGTSAAVGGAVAAGAAGLVGSQIASSVGQSRAANKAADNAVVQNAAAIQSVKDAQSSASTTAQEAIRRRTSSVSQSVYTSPLGLSGQAETSRKVLLGQ